MRTDELLPRGATAVRHCDTVREADLLVQAITEQGADADDLVLLAHAPTPVDAPPPARPAWWVLAVPVVVGLAGAVAGGAVGVVLVALSLAALVLVNQPRTSPRRLLVASSYDLVASGDAAQALAAGGVGRV